MSSATQSIRDVLEDSRFAYLLACESCNTNTDFADFASSQMLTSFQQALDDPNLTYEALCSILRCACSRETKRRCKTPWSLFIAKNIHYCASDNKIGSI